jgi:hypothetical protein
MTQPEIGSFIFQFDRVMFVHEEGVAMIEGRLTWSFISPRWRAATREEVCDLQWRVATRADVYAWHEQERRFKQEHIYGVAGPRAHTAG